MRGGQIVADWNGELYFAIFDKKFPSKDVDPRIVVGSTPALLVLSLDAKIWHGDWPVIGNIQSNLEHYPQPAFKVRQSGVVHIVSRDRTVYRPASPQEAEVLQYRTTSYPAVVEDAVKAYFGMGEWRVEYDKMLAEHVKRSSALLNQGLN